MARKSKPFPVQQSLGLASPRFCGWCETYRKVCSKKVKENFDCSQGARRFDQSARNCPSFEMKNHSMRPCPTYGHTTLEGCLTRHQYKTNAICAGCPIGEWAGGLLGQYPALKAPSYNTCVSRR